MYARITLVQVLMAYTNPESHNAQRHRQTDRQTDGQQAAANSRSYCVAVRSAKNEHILITHLFATVNSKHDRGLIYATHPIGFAHNARCYIHVF